MYLLITNNTNTDRLSSSTISLNQLELHGGFPIVTTGFKIDDLFCDFSSVDDQITMLWYPGTELWIPTKTWWLLRVKGISDFTSDDELTILTVNQV